MGAKYTAPDISLYEPANKPKKEAVVGAQMEYQFPVDKPFVKEENEVGKLGVAVTPPQDALFEVDNYEVGKLKISEADPTEVQLPTGTFGGLPQGESPTSNTDRAPFKEWDTTYQVGPKKEPEGDVWCDGKFPDPFASPDAEATRNSSVRSVGKLGFRAPGEMEDIFVGEVPVSGNNNAAPGSRDANVGPDDQDYNDPREGALFLQRNDSTSSSSSSPRTRGINTVSDGSTQTDPLMASEKEKRKRCCLYFLLFVLLLLVIFLGVLLGQKNNEAEESTAMAVAAAGGSDGAGGSSVFLIPPIILIANETTNNDTTNVPSLYPSLQPSSSTSRECPVGTKAFSIEYESSLSSSSSLQNIKQNWNDKVSSDVTWKIKDACSGNIVAQCLPCSSGTLLFSGGTNNNEHVKLTRKRTHDSIGHTRLLQAEGVTTTKCLPLNNEYVFEVTPLEDPSDSCCGFDPSSSTLSYDNVAARQGGVAHRNSSLFGVDEELSSVLYFGERETPCPSNVPSLSPTIKESTRPSLAASEKPSYVPSHAPSTFPTFSPTTSQPTKSPVVFLGGCPESFVQLSYYMIGTQVESNGIIYECISYSCGSYGFEPGLESSSLWRHGWDVVGSCEGTRAPTSYPTVSPTASPTNFPSKSPTLYPTMPPTSSPSKSPTLSPSNAPSSRPTLAPTPRPRTRQPTNRPTPQPTCSTETDFNLCIAVDMSGSVCGNSRDRECSNCRASFLPMLFASECRDNWVSEDTCCNNFAKVQDFSSLIVNVLGDFPAKKSFSVVQFATDARLVSGLKSAEQTISKLEQLDYTGGLTNHGAAIRACQRTLPSSSGFRKNFIMLITDGVSSEPNDPEGYAEAAATAAKFDGTFIIPVFISPNNDWSALSFMMRLSSDGKVFDVTDFDSLNSLQDRLVDQVSCA